MQLEKKLTAKDRLLLRTNFHAFVLYLGLYLVVMGLFSFIMFFVKKPEENLLKDLVNPVFLFTFFTLALAFQMFHVVTLVRTIRDLKDNRKLMMQGKIVKLKGTVVARTALPLIRYSLILEVNNKKQKFFSAFFSPYEYRENSKEFSSKRKYLGSFILHDEVKIEYAPHSKLILHIETVIKK